MKYISTPLHGVYIIEHDVYKDDRGSFVKTFLKSQFSERKLDVQFSECYYTKSKEDVIRGMHFQLPPHDHAKLVTIIQGTVVDVILDLRKSSPTFKQHFAVELSRENRKSVYIPHGCAHGFGVLSDMAIVYYMVTSEYSESHDFGVHFDSFGYDWPISKPVTSERDKAFLSLDNFVDFFD